MLSPSEAEKRILETVALFPTEDCPLAEAHGRVLRQGIRADRDLPPFDRVTMDGYGVRSDAIAAGTRSFRVLGVQGAGMLPKSLGDEPDGCIEVMTGAVLPRGADCVVPYEHTARTENAMALKPGFGGAPGGSVHRRGSDHPAGAEILAPGVRLGGREIAVAAACGVGTVLVALRPRIAVVATGDELVEVGMPVGPHQIRRSNDYALRAALIGAGYPRVECFHVRDVPEEIEQRLRGVLAEFDVLVLCGGVSKGRFDHLPAALEKMGARTSFHGVSQRPGKPFWFGMSPRRTPIFALPGNPISAYTCLHRYVLPALSTASGCQPPARRRVALATPQSFHNPLTHFVPVKLGEGPAAEPLAQPEDFNTSGDFASLVRTDGFVELPGPQQTFPKGYLAAFWPWA